MRVVRGGWIGSGGLILEAKPSFMDGKWGCRGGNGIQSTNLI